MASEESRLHEKNVSTTVTDCLVASFAWPNEASKETDFICKQVVAKHENNTRDWLELTAKPEYILPFLLLDLHAMAARSSCSNYIVRLTFYLSGPSGPQYGYGNDSRLWCVPRMCRQQTDQLLH